MTTTAHTPGPWQILWGRQTTYPLGIYADGRNIVTSVACPSRAESEANAHLIAAAPTMLDDLRDAARILRHYETLHRTKGTRESLAKADINAKMAAQFEATIAKATGESA